jgi:membrane protein required for beta-lactamase induction
MTFFIIFISLVAELTWLSFAPLRGVGWVSRWYAWLSRVLDLRRWTGNATVLVAVAVPVAAVAYVFSAVLDDSALLTLVGGIAVLLFCSGPRDLASEIEFYKRDYLDQDDEALPLDRDNFLNRVSAAVGDPDRPYEVAVVRAANDGLFAPMFWFVILGPVGAILFRLSSAFVGNPALTAGELQIAARLYEILLWVPARLLAIGLGLAGTLGPVLEVFAGARHGLGHSGEFLGAAALAALGTHRDDTEAGDDDHIAAIHAMFGLVKRGFLVWLVALALLVAAGVV